MPKFDWLKFFASPFHSYGGDDIMFPQTTITPEQENSIATELEASLANASKEIESAKVAMGSNIKKEEPKVAESFLAHTKRIIQAGHDVAMKEVDRLSTEITRYQAESDKYLTTLRNDLKEAELVLTTHKSSLESLDPEEAPKSNIIAPATAAAAIKKSTPNGK